MTTKIRRQLTLFLQKDKSELVEKIRQQFNPKQFELIKAHITLCREDEIENIDQVLKNLTSLNEQEITIQFEKPTSVNSGHVDPVFWDVDPPRLRGNKSKNSMSDKNKKVY